MDAAVQTSVDAASGDGAGTGTGTGVAVGAGCAAGATVTMVTLDATGHGDTAQGLMVAGALCVQVKGSVHQGWGVSNGDGRMLTIVGATTAGPFSATTMSTGGAVTAGPDGNVYFNLTAGSKPYVSMYFF
jgi:hypothetical protein